MLGKRPSVQNGYDTYQLCIISNNWRKVLETETYGYNDHDKALLLDSSERNTFCVLIIWKGSLKHKSKYDNLQSWFYKYYYLLFKLKLICREFLKWDRFELSSICYNRILKNLIQYYARHSLLLKLFNLKMVFFLY